MKRVLLDHCVPEPVRDALANCEVFTAEAMGWSRLSNGDLLRAVEAAGFNVFVTADKNLRYQQNLSGRKIAILILPTNRLPVLRTMFVAIASEVSQAMPGDFREIAP